MSMDKTLAWVHLHDYETNNEIVVPFLKLRSITEVELPDGLWTTKLEECTAEAAPIFVRESIAEIFMQLEENSIAVHSSDLGIMEH